MSVKVGIVGVSGYGGGEILRLVVGHPSFELCYVGGESSAGQRLVERFPGLPRYAEVMVERWDPRAIPDLDLLFVSLLPRPAEVRRPGGRALGPEGRAGPRPAVRLPADRRLGQSRP
jgi:N-acetyl-gamma-glutamylphosphate reductase